MALQTYTINGLSAGITDLRAQGQDASGASVGSVVSGFVDNGNGSYFLRHDFGDAIAVRIYQAATPSTTIGTMESGKQAVTLASTDITGKPDVALAAADVSGILRVITGVPSMTVSLASGSPTLDPSSSNYLFFGSFINGYPIFLLENPGIAIWYDITGNNGWVVTESSSIGTFIDGWSTGNNYFEGTYVGYGAYLGSEVTVAITAVAASVAQLAIIDPASIAAIKVKTDNLPADPASNTQVNTRLATSGYTVPPDATAIAAATQAGMTAQGYTTARAVKLDNLDAAVSSGGSGTGDTLVNHNTGGADALRVLSAPNVGVDNATIRAYLKSEFDAGIYTVRATDLTSSDGRWANGIYIDAGQDYYIKIEKQGDYAATTKTLTWNSGTNTWIVS